jgi:hypothetical protein
MVEDYFDLSKGHICTNHFRHYHRLNMEVDLQKVYLGSMSRDVHSCTHCLRPRNLPHPPALGVDSYTRALYWYLSQERRHLFVTPWSLPTRLISFQRGRVSAACVLRPGPRGRVRAVPAGPQGAPLSAGRVRLQRAPLRGRGGQLTRAGTPLGLWRQRALLQVQDRKVERLSNLQARQDNTSGQVEQYSSRTG